MAHKYKVESLLAARLFLEPRLVANRIYFISDLSGRLSLYVMNEAGSVPEPLLPPDIALQNPHLIEGTVYEVLPDLGKIMIMLDQDGDENYQPMFIPLEGGIPVPLFGDRFADQQLMCPKCDANGTQALFVVDPRTDSTNHLIRVDLATTAITPVQSSIHQIWPAAMSDDFARIVVSESYTTGDVVLSLWEAQSSQCRLLYGTPLADRPANAPQQINGIGVGAFVSPNGLLLTTSLFDDRYGLGYFNLEDAREIVPVTISGIMHQGAGELEQLKEVAPGRYTLSYNIDGSSWLYEGTFDEAALRFDVISTLCGTGTLSNGVVESIHFDQTSRRYSTSFSTAITPSQIYLLEETVPQPRTNQRVLGIAPHLLAPGEDASYTSHDGLRISARLYRPAHELGFRGPRPVVFYIHGGPQSQERPDFTWFSMPLIQYLTLNGIAVFVPNVRGSTGYGMDYVKHVDRDWGGQDRLDHVAAFAHLRSDPNLDMNRAGVMGRSYGGYMTLTLAGRHPELWKAACDMFGPYNLFSFLERLPPTWRTYFEIALGHPEKDRDFLVERSPNTWLHQLACPMLVIQGANDPRVVERESRDLVEELRGQGKQIDYLVFDNEGHDVIKYENKVRCYTRIVEFFVDHL